MINITGSCPMGCGPTLVAIVGGTIMCSALDCTDRYAVSTILQDNETEHVVTIEAESFAVKHPLRERINDALLTCDLHQMLSNVQGQGPRPGIYRATSNPDTSPAAPEWILTRQTEPETTP